MLAPVSTDGVVTNAYGMLIGDVAIASNNWAIKTSTGLVEFGDAVKVHGNVGFFNTTPQAKQAVTGAKLSSDVALANLLTALSTHGLVTDSTT